MVITTVAVTKAINMKRFIRGKDGVSWNPVTPQSSPFMVSPGGSENIGRFARWGRFHKPGHLMARLLWSCLVCLSCCSSSFVCPVSSTLRYGETLLVCKQKTHFLVFTKPNQTHRLRRTNVPRTTFMLLLRLVCFFFRQNEKFTLFYTGSKIQDHWILWELEAPK